MSENYCSVSRYSPPLVSCCLLHVFFFHLDLILIFLALVVVSVCSPHHDYFLIGTYCLHHSFNYYFLIRISYQSEIEYLGYPMQYKTWNVILPVEHRQ